LRILPGIAHLDALVPFKIIAILNKDAWTSELRPRPAVQTCESPTPAAHVNLIIEPATDRCGQTVPRRFNVVIVLREMLDAHACCRPTFMEDHVSLPAYASKPRVGWLTPTR
jgi:hypothetical protein